MTMETTASRRTARPARLVPQPVDYALAVAVILLFCLVIAALVRRPPHWAEIPAAIWLHLVTVTGALALSPVMMLRRRGDRMHRALGWLCVVLLMATASFDIRTLIHGRISPINVISALVIVETPLIVWFARRHDVREHAIAVRSTIAGALLIAGFFTLPFGRLLGTWLFG